MMVEFRWQEVNTYQASVSVEPEDMIAQGLSPDSTCDVQRYLEDNESVWTGQVSDWNACHQAVLERDVVAVSEIDAKTL